MNRRCITYLLLTIILCTAILLNQQTNLIQAHINSKILSNIQILKSMENESIVEIEKEIKKVQIKYKTQTNKDRNYKEIFNNAVVMGDSQTEGLVAYNILSKNSVLAKRGSNILDGLNNIKSLSNLNPSDLFILYGMNDILIYEENIDKFIDDYSKLINLIKGQLTNTNIYINAILPVNDKALKNRPIYETIDKYNEKLEQLCKELSVEFIDARYILEDEPDLYQGDGIHVKPEFYKKWLATMEDAAKLGEE